MLEPPSMRCFFLGLLPGAQSVDQSPNCMAPRHQKTQILSAISHGEGGAGCGDIPHLLTGPAQFERQVGREFGAQTRGGAPGPQAGGDGELLGMRPWMH